MAIKYLLTGKSAQFFRRNPRQRFSQRAANELVTKVSSGKSGRFQERRIREKHMVNGIVAHITYACFPLESEPSFLSGSTLREIRYAYLLLIEAGETIAVFRRNVEGVVQALSPFITHWKYEELGGLYAADNQAFERISLRTMSLAANVVRRRSLEADNLADSMAVSGVHRSIPNSFRTRGSKGIYTIAPGNARISRKDTRAELEELVQWVITTGEALNVASVNYSKSFLAEFCRAVPLEDLPTSTTPNAILFDFSELRSIWEMAPADYEFVLMGSPRAKEGRTLSESQVHALFARLDQVLLMDGDKITYTSKLGKPRLIANIRVNKNSISVRSGLLERLIVRSASEKIRLSAYANQENNFLITFSEPEYGYAERQLFRDATLLGSIDSLLRIFVPHSDLTAVFDEKAISRAEFQKGGIFRLVEDSLAPRGAFLVCDDLGDEWADYICLDSTAARSRLQFIHCKHGDKSSSASALQEPIGQAVKNLSRMYRGSAEFASKIDNKWTLKYSTTNIERIRRGAKAADLKKAFNAVLNDPNTERSVILVLSGLSIKQLRNEFDALTKGTARPHVSQLLWLLAGFMGACREHGVRAEIVCQP
jgi:hypothetical protein